MSKTDKASPPDPTQNHILSALPAKDLERLLPDLKLVDMPLGWTLSESGDHVNFLHFPVSGIVSLIYVLEDGSSSEIALVGNEGMVESPSSWAERACPAAPKCKAPAGAYRLSRQIMKWEFALGGQLQHLALLYTQALICQTSQTAVCNQHHTLDQQLCRWLLMSVDRLHEDKLEITQEMIANLLGVRRESITQAAGRLQKEGLISYMRGRIKIENRAKLAARACECYEAVKLEYQRLLP
jgi:CRP-like cAMP-binding protein